MNQPLLAARAVTKWEEIHVLVDQVRRLGASRSMLEEITDRIEEGTLIARALSIKESLGRSTSLKNVRTLTREYERLTTQLDRT